MSKQPLITLVGGALALTVLGCRNEGMDQSDRTQSPSPMAEPGEVSPPLIEEEEAIGDEDDYPDDGRRSPPPAAGEQTDPLEPDPDMPEAGDPGADPKQPPPPSTRASRG